MTDSISLSPRLAAALPARFTLPRVVAEDRADNGMLLGLLAVTLPTVAYALVQAWNLAGSNALTQAVRAFVP